MRYLEIRETSLGVLLSSIGLDLMQEKIREMLRSDCLGDVEYRAVIDKDSCLIRVIKICNNEVIRQAEIPFKDILKWVDSIRNRLGSAWYEMEYLLRLMKLLMHEDDLRYLYDAHRLISKGIDRFDLAHAVIDDIANDCHA